jgi:hypothetical protein
MSVKSIRFKKNRGSARTDRDYSPNIWSDCLFTAILEGTVNGVIFDDDFTKFPKSAATTEGNWGDYAQFSSTGGTLTADTGQGGGVVMGSDGDDEGASIRSLATPFKIARGLKKLWFEAVFKKSTIADTKHEFFVGLMQDVALTATMPITATAGTLADTNLVGFYFDGTSGNGAVGSTTYKADGVTAVVVGTDEVTGLAADTYVKVGFTFDPDPDPFVADPARTTGNKNLLTFYQNNLRLASYKLIPSAAGTDFPNDIGLGPVAAVLNATGSTPGTVTLDKWRCVQLL